MSGTCDMATDVASISRINELSKTGRGSVIHFSRLAIVQTLFGTLLAPAVAGILVDVPESMPFVLLGSISLLSIVSLRGDLVTCVSSTSDEGENNLSSEQPSVVSG